MGGTALLNASDGSHTISAPIVLNSTAAQLGGGTLTLNGGVSGTGGLSVGNGLLVLTTSNNYSGPTTAITGGTLALLNANPFPNSTLTMSGGAVVFDSSVSPKVFNIGGLAGTSNLALQDNAASPNPVKLNVGGNGAVTNYTGLLSGAGTLNVVGPGAYVGYVRRYQQPDGRHRPQRRHAQLGFRRGEQHGNLRRRNTPVCQHPWQPIRRG